MIWGISKNGMLTLEYISYSRMLVIFTVCNVSSINTLRFSAGALWKAQYIATIGNDLSGCPLFCKLQLHIFSNNKFLV
jgi:hypothetical protein